MEQQYHSAEECINETVLDEGKGSPGALLDALNTNAEALKAAEKAKVQHYITVTRSALHGMTIQPLSPGIGGIYNGTSITMATSTLMVGATIGSSLDQITETADHEKYHQANDHLAPMIMGSSAEAGHVVTIGGEAFTDTEAVEGLTVYETGHGSVSSKYVSHMQRLMSAAIHAALTVDDLREAINEKKDYRLLDDADRADSEDPSFATAA
jgi:hypothetical protein